MALSRTLDPLLSLGGGSGSIKLPSLAVILQSTETPSAAEWKTRYAVRPGPSMRLCTRDGLRVHVDTHAWGTCHVEENPEVLRAIEGNARRGWVIPATLKACAVVACAEVSTKTCQPFQAPVAPCSDSIA